MGWKVYTYVESLMDLETASPRVPLVAVRIVTNEGLFASVGQFMGLQVTFCNELLLALVTDEGSLTGVGPHVSLQVASF